MISGTNPTLAKLYNWLARNRSSVGYNVSQTVNPVVDVADLWPKTPVIRQIPYVLVGGGATLTLWDGAVDGGASGGPYHCMAHRFSINLTVLAVTFAGYIYLSEPDTNKTIILYASAIPMGNNAISLRDIYVPPRWSLLIDVFGTIGDTVAISSELSIAPAVEPLPKGI